MAGNATKKRNPTDMPPAEDGSSSGAWRPEVETDREFNPFANTTVAGVVGEERNQISDTPPEPTAVEQSAGVSTARRASRKRRPGGQGGRAGRRAKGSGQRAVASRAKTKTKTKARSKTKTKVRAKARVKAKAKAKVKAGSKRTGVARKRSARTARRGTRRRSARRR